MNQDRTIILAFGALVVTYMFGWEAGLACFALWALMYTLFDSDPREEE